MVAEAFEKCHIWNYIALLPGNSESMRCYNNTLLLWKRDWFRVAKQWWRFINFGAFFKYLSNQNNLEKIKFIKLLFVLGYFSGNGTGWSSSTLKSKNFLYFSHWQIWQLPTLNCCIKVFHFIALNSVLFSYNITMNDAIKCIVINSLRLLYPSARHLTRLSLSLSGLLDS